SRRAPRPPSPWRECRGVAQVCKRLDRLERAAGDEILRALVVAAPAHFKAGSGFFRRGPSLVAGLERADASGPPPAFEHDPALDPAGIAGIRMKHVLGLLAAPVATAPQALMVNWALIRVIQGVTP